MKLNCNLIWILINLPCLINCWFEQCNYNIYVNQSMYIVNPNYPQNYAPKSSCLYHLIAPLDHEINIECNIKMPKPPNSPYCGSDYFYIGTDGNRDLRGSEYICGDVYIQRKSMFNKLTIAHTSSSIYYSGSYSCLVTFRKQPCDCGWSMRQRIVGGIDAGITEFPFIAALKSASGSIFCGGNIISHRIVLTAAHCLNHDTPQKVIVGEHDFKTNAETPYTQEHFVIQIRKHEAYNGNNNDIAIVVTETIIEWSLGVGPICLPFLYSAESFEGVRAELAGWGTEIMSGPLSTVLKKTQVQVISNEVCKRTYPFVNYLHLCTYTSGQDSCQYDSGGPLIWKSKRLQLIGIIAFGNECGGKSPGGNTRITAQLAWIKYNTRDEYCEMP